MWIYSIILIAVIVCGVYDFLRGRIPNYLTIPLFFLGLGYSLFTENPVLVLKSFLIAFAIGFFAWIIGGMGGGDLKLMVALGVWLGSEPYLTVLIYGSLIGILWGTIKMAKMGILKQQFLRFVRGIYLFRAMGFNGMITKLPDDEKEKMPKNAVPFGTCLAIALLIFIVQQQK
jgi:Flp pilus assembly protein protease CpaA